MIVVIFEVQPNKAGAPCYFDLAAELRPELKKQDGFISIERFESMVTPGKFLSLSFWRDEAAVSAWRNHPGHGEAQVLGKTNCLRNTKSPWRRRFVFMVLRETRRSRRRCADRLFVSESNAALS